MYKIDISADSMNPSCPATLAVPALLLEFYIVYLEFDLKSMLIVEKSKILKAVFSSSGCCSQQVDSVAGASIAKSSF